MHTPRQGSARKQQGRGPRNNRGPGNLPAIAAAPQTIATLVRDANDAASEADSLRAHIFRTQQQSRRRRMELHHDVSEAARLDAERLANERENLEAQLVDNMRYLHTLEQSVVDHNEVTREQKKNARSVAAQLRKLRQVDVMDNEAASIEGDGIKALKELQRQLEAERRGIEDELQGAYRQKERTEADIGARRQGLAINEALLRACHEQMMVLPEFDDLPCTSEEAQGTSRMQSEAYVAA